MELYLQRLLKNQTSMKLLPYTIILSTALFFLACGNSKDVATTDSDDNTPTPEAEKAILVTDISPFKSNASTTIEKVSLEGNILTLKVSYSGGCKDHEFQLVGNKMISKSLPPKRGIFLYHNGNEDSCRESITKELRFDISAFAYLDQEIHLSLQGWEPIIAYTLAK